MMLHSKRGFTIFFATLIASLALAVGIAIFELTIRELDLSQTATASQYAIYAADVGAECALFWDYKCPTSGGPAYCAESQGSAFATSTSGAGVDDDSNLTCNGLDITSTIAEYDNSDRSASAATTTFTIRFDQSGQQSRPHCAKVVVAKSGFPSQTVITSRGYNTCTTGATLQLERSLQLSY